MGHIVYSNAQLRELAAQAVRHAGKAQRASDMYNQKKPGIVAHLLNQNLEEYNYRKAFASNYTLNDLQDEYTWHRREQHRIQALIQMELNLREASKNAQ